MPVCLYQHLHGLSTFIFFKCPSVSFLGSHATYCVWIWICHTDIDTQLLISWGREDQCIIPLRLSGLFGPTY